MTIKEVKEKLAIIYSRLDNNEEKKALAYAIGCVINESRFGGDEKELVTI